MDNVAQCEKSHSTEDHI